MNKEQLSAWMNLTETKRALECGRKAVLSHVRAGHIRVRVSFAPERYLRADVEKLVAANQVPQAFRLTH